MDLKFLDAAPTAAEVAAVDSVLGQPASGWEGGEHTRDDDRVARLGHAARSRRDELLPALHALQDHIGWITKGGLDYVCRRLSIPPAEAYGVATFYALLSVNERPGRVAHVCDDTACRAGGVETMFDELEGRLGPPGGTKDDGMWLRGPCLGQCEKGSAAFLQIAGEDNAVIAPVTADQVASALGGETVDPANDTG
ncbi:MAG: NADH-quinone oxidoreductase subunit E, partial [Acidimicrobiia bacterium]|nr:NADH-quinone oxidoreductase subunit E [Acidimicrobiia bacterium]